MKVWTVDWQVYEMDGEISNRRRLFSSVEGAQRFVDELDNARTISGAWIFPTYQEIEVHE